MRNGKARPQTPPNPAKGPTIGQAIRPAQGQPIQRAPAAQMMPARANPMALIVSQLRGLRR